MDVLVAGSLGLVMMMLDFRMRKGSRGARGWLLGLALVATALALLELAGVIALVALTAVEGLIATASLAVLAQLVDGSAVVLALVGAILPFLPPARAFFATTPPAAPGLRGPEPTPID